MKRASLVVSEFYRGNKIFDLSDTHLNRDNCLHPFWLLKKELAIHGYDLATQDVHRIEEADIIIYNEMPKKLPSSFEEIKKSYLLLFESELIRPDNWDISKHIYFQSIFTWNDDYVDEKKYFKINFSQNFPESRDRAFTSRQGFACLIAGNKSSNHPLELYSKRLEVINWYEKFYPELFDLYGVGWDRVDSSTSFLLKVLKKIDFLKYIPHKPPKNYKGLVQSKNDTLRDYKFSYCFENARDISGYITEKIFDSLFAGCIPIYWGAPNIEKFIPADCYIDMRKFKSVEDVHRFLVSTSSEYFSNMQNNIKNFISSEQAKTFNSDHFVATLLEVICG